MASPSIFPLALWLSGTNQNSIPANDNASRMQILTGNVISQAVTAQPASPSDGDAYIIAATHTGSAWSSFTPKDLAIYRLIDGVGAWYAFAPVEGVRVSVNGSIFVYESGSWVSTAGGGGDAVDVNYDNSTSGLSADNVQEAIDELASSGGGGMSWNPQTASYTLVLGDAQNAVAMNVASANNLTVPPNSSVAFAVGTSILVEQEGAGLTTIVADAGVTIRKRGSSLALGGQYALATLVKRGTDEWILSGDIAA